MVRDSIAVFSFCLETEKALCYAYRVDRRYRASSQRASGETSRVAEKRGSYAREVIVEYSKCAFRDRQRTEDRMNFSLYINA